MEVSLQLCWITWLTEKKFKLKLKRLLCRSIISKLVVCLSSYWYINTNLWWSYSILTDSCYLNFKNLWDLTIEWHMVTIWAHTYACFYSFISKYSIDCGTASSHGGGQTPEVMVWGMISYHGQSNSLRIEDNLNSNRYGCEVLQPEVVPFLQGIPKVSFSRIMHPHMSQRLFETSDQPKTCYFFICMLIWRIYRLLYTCGIWLVAVLLVICALQLQKTNFSWT